MIQICRKDKKKVYKAIRTGKINVAEIDLCLMQSRFSS